MAKCHLPQSMTKIYGQNFKKNVIDDGQWQKNCHLLKVIYPYVIIYDARFHEARIHDASTTRPLIFDLDPCIYDAYI